MNATTQGRRSDALYYDNVTRRALCDMVANLEADNAQLKRLKASVQDQASDLRKAQPTHKEADSASAVVTSSYLHERLVSLMAERGITQAELARRMQVSRTTAHNWFWGVNEPSIEVLRRICRVLGCGWNDLLGEVGR
jgi:DNA-binding XRE family transcriptional regulator